MNDRKNFLQRLASLLPGRDMLKKSATYPFMLILLTLGIAFMLIGSFLSSESKTVETINTAAEEEDVEPAFKQTTSEKGTIERYEQQYANELKGALQSISGVGEVEVIVNVDSSSESVLEKNRSIQNQTTDETDREGGKRQVEDKSVDEQVVIIRKGDQESPIVVKTEKPKIRGVLVVAKGAENVQIKKMITDAVTRVLDVDSHRVAVLPKK
ncbi:stage III sporulation protein AG [Aeribacillus sp. FSL K6-1305]|uniref:stage III sporulation protein AG n=1 Tax=Aeribacillus sp. FSL K6-1305 TaxID=2954569 RepID=UPI0030FD8219